MNAGKLGAPNPSSGPSRRAQIDTLFARKADAPSAVVVGDKDRVRTGAIAAMGTSLRELTESARSADVLRERVDAGAVIVELEPADIDESMVVDRLPAEIDPRFDALVESIRVHGQQVPVLVRASPGRPGRFQIAYGRRRAKAAARLGVRVKAIVRSLGDDELVIAQGKENLERRDLSYIEKAIFARRLEDIGFERPVILAALSTDKGDLSRYISLARSIPEGIAQAVGPAAKAGRSRWAALAELLAIPGAGEIADAAIGSDGFRALDSDGRFAMLIGALERRTSTAKASSRVWTNVRGQKAGKVEHRSDRTILTINEDVAPDFGRHLAGRLDELYAQFTKRKARGCGD